jgi:uncharacterized membrane protein YcgQ (UPF0703/DUF1980 family)
MKNILLIIMALLIVISGCSKGEADLKFTKKREASANKETLLQEIYMQKDKMQNTRVTVVGKFLIKEDDNDGQFTLKQYVAGCCPSHGEREIKIKVKYKDANNLPFNSWVRVKGPVIWQKEDPEIVADTVDAIAKPQVAVLRDVSNLH